ncbi:MAG: hypothetical protein QW520_04560 [Methanomassiliicoccales archaeon]
MDIIGILMGFLQSLADNPLEYALVLYLYAIATAVILPVPVEFGLFLAPSLGILTKSFIVAAGKATGCVIVFYLGLKVEKAVYRWSRRFKFFAWFVDLMEKFVAKTWYFGLYILLSIPIMTDTVPIYLFSIFNKNGVMTPGYFTIVNFLAAINRCMIVIFLAKYFGIYVV